MKRARGRKQLFQFPNAGLKAVAHLVSAGNRRVVDRLDNGNRIETIWTRDRIAYRKLWNILKAAAESLP